jgi:hypothetical protein
MPNDRNTLVVLGIVLAARIAARNGFANGVKLVLSSLGTRAALPVRSFQTFTGLVEHVQLDLAKKRQRPLCAEGRDFIAIPANGRFRRCLAARTRADEGPKPTLNETFMTAPTNRRISEKAVIRARLLSHADGRLTSIRREAPSPLSDRLCRSPR